MAIFISENNTMKGFFITFEGGEGAGKSTQIDKTKSYLESKGRKVITIREPGSTPIAEDIRNLLKSVRSDDRMCDTAELLLMYAARAQLVNTLIKPKLEEGFDILCDRHDLSTIAYQGGGRMMNMEDINAIRNVVLKSFRPDLTVLIDVPPKVGMARARNRGELDRFEISNADFFERVDKAYHDYAKNHPETVAVVDGTLSVQEVSEQIIKNIQERLDV